MGPDVVNICVFFSLSFSITRSRGRLIRNINRKTILILAFWFVMEAKWTNDFIVAVIVIAEQKCGIDSCINWLELVFLPIHTHSVSHSFAALFFSRFALLIVLPFLHVKPETDIHTYTSQIG